MISVEYPAPAFKIEKRGDAEYIFDPFRKRWVVLTPEEWVRQNFLQYMLQTLNYPASLIAVEKEIRLGELKKRFDILVYNNEHAPWLMVECKAMDIVLNESVLQQALRYNISIPVAYLIITNGRECMGWCRTSGELVPVTRLPAYPN
jgi:Type I restriction enzyme R protein N terminus (HSDR_N)